MNWISVNKVKPQKYTDVLVWVKYTEIAKCKVAYLKTYSGESDEEEGIYCGWYLNEHDWTDDKGENRIKDGQVTHWTPLPDGPNGEH